MAKPGRRAFLAVTYRYKWTHSLWLEQFQIADSARGIDGANSGRGVRRLSGSVFRERKEVFDMHDRKQKSGGD
jgi:hypothetical protein